MTVPLHISAIDGTGLRELFVPSSGIAWDPAVSRGAGWAVFAVGPTFGAVDMDVDIWRIRLDGSEPVNLTPDSPWNDAFPAISADGKRIVFRSSRDGVQPGPDHDRPRTAWPSAIYVMDGEGGNLRRLTDADTRETAPAISSNGEWVAYVVHENGVAKIWLRRVDGSEARLLEPERSHIPDISMHPSFSPDGKWVVFTSDRAGFNDEWPLTREPQPYGELWAAPVAGGPAIRLTHDKWEDGPNDWGYVRLPARQP